MKDRADSRAEAEILRRLGRVALGQEPADMILAGGDILNVYSGEVVKNQTVLTSGGRIAYVGEPGDFPRGSGTEVHNFQGYFLLPGFIDGHSHVDAWLELREYVRWSLPGGTTSVITECTGVANTLGKEGVRAFIRQFADLPQNFYVTAPMIPYFSGIRENGKTVLGQGDIEEILSWPQVVGLGEIYWSRMLTPIPQDVLELIAYARVLGKTVEGHTAGAKQQKLATLAALGFDSCHEPITAGETRERIRLGWSTMIREGSIRRELETVLGPLLDMELDMRRGILASDGIWPNNLVKNGHMEFIVNKAISLGLDPIKAVQMVTLNVAEHFHLESRIGGIAPGRDADILVTPALNPIEAKWVFVRGRLAAQDGNLLDGILPERGGSEATFRTDYRLQVAPVHERDFEIAFPQGAAECPREESEELVRVRVIECVTDIVTREITLELPMRNGLALASDLKALDLVKVAVIDRYEGNNRKAIGLMKGYGLQRGAIASSFSFDEGNLVVIGSSDQEMALAVNRVRELNGGIVYCAAGGNPLELPLPVYGAVSLLGAAETAERIEALLGILHDRGCPREHNSLLTLLTTTFTAIPSIRLSVKGYRLAKENVYKQLFV